MEEVIEKSSEQAEIKIKPLSNNAFVAFFQRIGRWWLGLWYGFADKHEKLAPLIYKVFFFVVFSMGVTIWQFIIMAIVPMFLPKTGAVGWPMVPIAAAGGNNFIIFGDENGWATFICFEIAVFTAQCINFPLQRNITYKSHGNPWFQAMWYFIGWVLVSVATNAIWGLCNAFLIHWGCPEVVNGLLKTILTGGVSMVIFFFIFMIIFPDRQKQAKTARKKYEKLKAKGAPEEKVELARQKCETLERIAEVDKARREALTAESAANSKAVAWDAAKQKLEKLKEKNAEEAELTAQSELIEKRYGLALEAAEKRDRLRAEYEAVKSADDSAETAQAEAVAAEKPEEISEEPSATESAEPTEEETEE